MELGACGAAYTLSVRTKGMGEFPDVFRDEKLSGLVDKMATAEYVLPKNVNTRIAKGSGVDGKTIRAFRNMYKETVKTQRLIEETSETNRHCLETSTMDKNVRFANKITL